MGNKYKTNPWIHTLYISAIMLIILVFVIILMSKDSVSEAAMDNVSFAATIVSIVLAVISIVISVVASFKTYQNLGGMHNIEKRINESISRLKGIDKHVLSTNKKVDNLQALLRPTPQDEINDEAQKTIAEISDEERQSGKAVYSVPGIKQLERRAVEHIAKEFSLTNLMFDYTIKGHYNYNFDGIARKGNVNWLIDVKLFRHSSFRIIISRMNKVRQEIIKVTGESTEIIVAVLLTQSVDIESVKSHWTPIFLENNITVRFYRLSEFEA